MQSTPLRLLGSAEKGELHRRPRLRPPREQVELAVLVGDRDGGSGDGYGNRSGRRNDGVGAEGALLPPLTEGERPQRARSSRARSRSRPRAESVRQEGIDLDAVTVRGGSSSGRRRRSRDRARRTARRRLSATSSAACSSRPPPEQTRRIVRWSESATPAARLRFAVERCAVLDEARDPGGTLDAWEELALVLALIPTDKWAAARISSSASTGAAARKWRRSPRSTSRAGRCASTACSTGIEDPPYL